MDTTFNAARLFELWQHSDDVGVLPAAALDGEEAGPSPTIAVAEVTFTGGRLLDCAGGLRKRSSREVPWSLRRGLGDETFRRRLALGRHCRDGSDAATIAGLAGASGRKAKIKT